MIYFVGMHNKEGMKPLDSKTMSGRAIDAIMCELSYKGYVSTKTNLCDTDYLPVDWLEINEHRRIWLEKYNPNSSDTIVLLGKWVQENACFDGFNNVIELRHPASMVRKGSMPQYIMDSINTILKELNQQEEQK